jgi:hypothetical protein
MTTSEACQVIVDLTRQLAAAHHERDAALTERDRYREIVSVAFTRLHELTRELERERAARYRLVEEFRTSRDKARNATAA